jgi:hypothetical protein
MATPALSEFARKYLQRNSIPNNDGPIMTPSMQQYLQRNSVSVPVPLATGTGTHAILYTRAHTFLLCRDGHAPLYRTCIGKA